MKHFLRSLFKSPPAPTATTITPPTATRLSPLDMPEILDLVFSFLNDRILQKTVALVCKRWFIINQNRFLRTFTYDDRWTTKQIAQRAPNMLGAGRLECLLSNRMFTACYTIRGVLGRYQEDYQQQLDKRNLVAVDKRNLVAVDKRKPTLFKFTPLTAIRFYVTVNMAISDTVPLPSTLTSLELVHFNAKEKEENLSNVFRMCPLLERLLVEVKQRPGLPLSWIKIEQANQPTPLPLRELHLRNVSFAQSDLENLLSFTPRLRTLKLMALSTRLNPLYDWARLLEHLKVLGITLDSLYFSEFGQQSHLEDMPRLIESCPSISDWTVWAYDVTPSLLQELTIRTSFLTTLEVFSQPIDLPAPPKCCASLLKDPPRLIHELLCTSPLLVHLKTLKTIIRPEFIDLFSRLDYFDAEAPDRSITTPPEIWMCRGLETLHVEVHDLFPSHILFGYIARVLPQLEDLYLDVPSVCRPSDEYPQIYPGICMRLHGGFCLLSRLRFLQRLVVNVGNFEHMAGQECKGMDLNWISLPGRSRRKYRRQRQVEMETWQSERGKADQREAARPPRPLPTIAKEADVEIWSQLENIGLLVDVEEAIKEIDSGALDPFPSLEHLSLRPYALGFRRPEVEVNAFLDKWR
ncbi:hypothetical protein BGW39_000412 [Mortierella sp. 14UC]|nr:hypothetical protein BGW39_000412 [Mortierella sp. 14UC]